jgi:putative hydrolase of the HAD superfamily
MRRVVRPRIRAVLFDLGGTLVDERDPVAWAEEAQAIGLTVEPEALAHWFDETEKAHDANGARWSREEFWQHVFDGAWGAPVDRERIRSFCDRFLRRGQRPLLYSDVPWCLEELRRRRLTLGIISNSRSEESVRAILRENGIERYFQVVVSSGTEGVAKPDPEIFRRAAARLGLPPEEIYYVGNLPSVDARAALAAGLHAVWLNRGGTGFGEDPPEITSLSEVPLAVRAAVRAR